MSFLDNYTLHKNFKRKYLAKGADYITFDESWRIINNLNTISFAVDDLVQCLKKSFDVTIGNVGEKEICFSLDSDIEEHSFKIEIEDNKVEFIGSDHAALVQAIYYAEDLMKSFGDASLKKETYSVKPSVWPRIASSALEGGMYTKEYLDLLLHFGYNGIICYYHDETAVNIAKSMEMLVYLVTDDASNVPEVYDGYILEAIPDKNELIFDERKIYSALYWNVDLSKRLDIINSLPEGSKLILSFDGDQEIERDGVKFKTTSGSIVMPECSDAFYECLKRAKERNINVIASTSGSGRTNEFPTVPYIPAMMQWFMRIGSLKETGVKATLETERMGFLPSIVGEFTKSQLLYPCDEGGIAIQKLVTMHYGAENSEKIMMAFKKVTDGVSWLVYNDADKEGPMQFGPAYPLICGEIYDYDFSSFDITFETDINLKAADSFNKAAMILSHVENTDIREIEYILRFMVNTLVTCANTKRWYRRYYTLKSVNDDYKKKFLYDQMVKIGEEELKNANDTADILICAEYLAYNNFEDIITPNALDAKIKLTQAAITEIKKKSQ